MQVSVDTGLEASAERLTSTFSKLQANEYRRDGRPL